MIKSDVFQSFWNKMMNKLTSRLKNFTKGLVESSSFATMSAFANRNAKHF